MAVAVFDPSVFKNRYREFDGVDSTLLAAYFSEACLYVNNTDASLIVDSNIRLMILNMVVAHLAELNTTPLVGRVTSVSVGGITTSTEYDFRSTGTRVWFEQTKYGAAAWVAMAPYRRALYITADS